MNPRFLQKLDLIINNFEICSKGLCHAIWYLFEKQRRSSVASRYKVISIQVVSMLTQFNAPVLLSKTTFRHRHCFLSSLATNGNDEPGLKLEKNWAFFSFFKITCYACNIHHKNNYGQYSLMKLV